MIQQFKNNYHLLQAILANLYYGFPSQKLRVIGVTGTDGKTTTTTLIHHILIAAGEKASMISTVGAKVGDKTFDIGFHVTTPSSFALQKYIKNAVEEKNKYLVLEVTSHALDQYRAYGIQFDIGVITNITHEHLDYHKTYDRYVDAKFRLLASSKVAIVNKDDESYERISSKFIRSKISGFTPRVHPEGQEVQGSKSQFKNVKLITYGLKHDSDVNPQIFSFKTQLFGEFNQYNCLAAIAVCKELGLSDKDIRTGLETYKPPIGRQEIVYDKEFSVMVDFAHTPNSFQKILPEVRKSTKGRLIHVFGAAGKRDYTKRPLMGKVSSEFSDIIILTAEDPRDESLDEINRQILSGIQNSPVQKSFTLTMRYRNEQGKKFKIQNKNSKVKIDKNEKYIIQIPDRKEAIAFAISIAQKGDFVLTTGKSHEKSMNYGKSEEPWDEFEAVKEAIRTRPHN